MNKCIGIIGSRERDARKDFEKIWCVFKKVYKKGDWITSGGCPRGGDRFAEKVARHCGCTIIIHHADWKTHKKSAGFVRNTLIANHADILIACVSPIRKGGTEDTITKFKKARGESNLYIV